MKNILEYKRVLTVFGASMAATAGVCWGYVYALGEVEKAFDDALIIALDREVSKIHRYYGARFKDVGPEEFSEIPNDVVLDTQHISIPKEVLNTEEGRAAVMAAIKAEVDPDPEPEDEQPVPIHAFDIEAPVEYDLEALLSERGPDAPYIISQEEFFNNSANYPEYKLTFFETNGVLADCEDKALDVIPDSDAVIGDQNLQRFGVMSGDKNTLYVQNDLTEAVYCVTRTFQSAEEAFFGPQADEETTLQHSSMGRRRPRRDDG